MKIVCLEIGRYRCGISACYIVSHKVTDWEIFLLQMRSHFNPRLHYYATRLDETESDDEILALFKQRKYRKAPYFERI